MPLAWRLPPSGPVLAADEVHVWRWALDPPAEHVRELAGLLSPDEQERASRFYFDRDRRRSIVAHGVLRSILARYLQLEPRQVSFLTTAEGKPYIAPLAGRHTPRFNLAHAHELAVCALAGERELGIDVEHVRPLPEAEPIAAGFFSAAEHAALLALPESEQSAAFFRCWTAKEAYLKAIGIGLPGGLDRVEVGLAADQPLRWSAPGGWLIEPLEPGPGYVAALAVKGDGLELVGWEWAWD